MDLQGASPVLASVAHRLATDPDFAHDLQTNGVEALVREFPNLSGGERAALNNVVNGAFSPQELCAGAARAQSDGDWWWIG